jgi:hypothetical protein
MAARPPSPDVPAGPSVDTPHFATTMLKAAWLSIGVGLIIEIAIVITGWLFGNSPAIKAVVSDGAGKVSWSVIVCTGLAAGTTASKVRGAMTGLLGLISAPMAFTAARAIQKTVAQALAAADPAAALPSVIAVSTVKGIEYALLGFIIVRIGTKTWGGLAGHVGVGLVTGVVFSAILVSLAVVFGHPAPPTPKLALLAVNELLFPIGCSLVLYSAAAIGSRLAR